jgi:hypothetical protein
MKSQRTIRTLSVIASAALIVGAFTAGTADAKKKKKPKPPAPVGCPVFTPVEPASDSEQTSEVAEAPVAKVTDEHTAEKPLVMEYSHGAAFWTINQVPVQEDTVFFNLQVQTAQPERGLYVFQEWSKTPGSDMDLYLWDGATGEQAVSSGSSNLAPQPLPPTPPVNHGQTTGAWGLESISGFPVTNCAGYTAESRAFTSPGEDMTLSVWLGDPIVDE